MNKRVRSRQQPATQGLPPAPAARIKHLGSRSVELKKQIEELECTLVRSPHALTQQRLAARDTLPALGSAARKTHKPRRKPLHQVRVERNRRLWLFIELGAVLLVLAVAVSGLKQWLGWWV